MSRITRKKTIGSVDISITQFEAMDGLPMGLRVAKIFGPVLIHASGLSEDDNIDKLAPVVETLFTSLEADVVRQLARDLLGCAICTVDGKLVDFVASTPREIDLKINMVFGSSVINLIKACAFSVEVNFSNFFDLARGLDLAQLKGNRSNLTKKSSEVGESGVSG